MKSRPLASSDIPSNFNLAAYDVCATWGLDEWCSAVTDRNLLRMAFDMAKRSPANGPSDTMEFVKQQSEHYFFNPLPSPKATSEPFDGHSSPVRDVSALEFFDGYFATHDERYSTFAALASSHIGEDWLSDAARQNEETLKSIPAWKMNDDVGVRNDYFMVAVDLGASDEMLVREFKTWLKSTRKAVGSARIKPAFTQRDFEEWHEKRLLPYLDLSLWAAARGAHFTLPVLADALFPNVIHVGVEDRIRKVVAPDAEFIVSPYVVSAMNVQRGAEQK
ncbi:DUF6387 family protein [Burkholderia cenocepacia]|uniref:DUF6387 family protein n=1 Tax=Burkholderia cenocepacia TaxID=95486 RepID=UPI00286EC582|nr:DUF6387 family protein [Burkholderia cenocepacia]